MSNTEQEYGLYYRYEGKIAKPDEPERLIHQGPQAECERVMRARAVRSTGTYAVRPLVEVKKSPKPFKRKR